MIYDKELGQYVVSVGQRVKRDNGQVGTVEGWNVFGKSQVLFDGDKFPTIIGFTQITELEVENE